MQDIATSPYCDRDRTDDPALLEAFRRWYQTVAAWPEEVFGDIETLIVGWAVLLANFVTASEDA